VFVFNGIITIDLEIMRFGLRKCRYSGHAESS